MALKDILTKILDQVSGDNADAVKQLVSQALTEANTVLRSLSDANDEAKTRREQFTSEKQKNEQLTGEIEALKKTSPDIESLKAKAAKYDTFIQQQETETRTKWTEKSKIFETKDTDKLFEKVSKVKDRFRHPAEGKELSMDDIQFNLAVYDTLDATEYFKTDTADIPAFDRPAGNGASPSATSKEQATLNMQKGQL